MQFAEPKLAPIGKNEDILMKKQILHLLGLKLASKCI